MRHASLRGMALRSALQQKRDQLTAHRARLQQRRDALSSQAGLLAHVAGAVEDVRTEAARARTALDIAVGGLQERQAREMEALQGVLPVRISGVAKRSRTAMQVRALCPKAPSNAAVAELVSWGVSDRLDLSSSPNTTGAWVCASTSRVYARQHVTDRPARSLSPNIAFQTV